MCFAKEVHRATFASEAEAFAARAEVRAFISNAGAEDLRVKRAAMAQEVQAEMKGHKDAKRKRLIA